jgi:SAM-dependent methyltransferase
VFAGNASARDLFNERTVEQDASVVPHLRKGMRLVDFGCGAGSLTCGFARLVAPDAIGRARDLAEQAGLSNARFAVANVNELELPPESFNVAHFSNMLMYLREPERALQLAFRSLKSGGIVAACEAHQAGDWATGPNAESVMLVRLIGGEENRAKGGGDTFIGGRLRALVRQAGFERVMSKPGYSAVLSDPKAIDALERASWSGTFGPSLLRHGISVERCDQLLAEISIWAESEDSLVAFAECAVLGWKP